MSSKNRTDWLSRFGGTVVSACVMSDIGDEHDERNTSTIGERRITIDIDDLDLGQIGLQFNDLRKNHELKRTDSNQEMDTCDFGNDRDSSVVSRKKQFANTLNNPVNDSIIQFDTFDALEQNESESVGGPLVTKITTSNVPEEQTFKEISSEVDEQTAKKSA